MFKKQFALTTILVLVFLAIRASSTTFATEPVIRYVAPTGTDTDDCRSSLSPCRTIQYAVKQALSGDVILVAGGIYTYSDSSSENPCPFLRTPAVVCFVDKRLTILGGYSEGKWYSADPARNPTVIDGQNTYRGVAVIGGGTSTAHLEMQGFTIQNCRAQGPAYSEPYAYDPSGFGGGMLVQHASVVLKDMVFRSNQAVGQNMTSGAGGQADGAAIRIEEPPAGTVSLLKRVIVEGNQSYGGRGPERGGVAFGAVFVYNATVIIEDSVFKNNLAKAGDSQGSGAYGSPPNADALGGGIAIQRGNVVLRRVIVADNQVRGGNAAQKGGGAYGGGVFVENFGAPVISVTISDSYIANNSAVGGTGATGGQAAGGGIDVDSGNITIERTYIVSNSVTGGISTNGFGGIGAGGGVYVFPGWSTACEQTQNCGATLNNVVIAWNEARQGNGNPYQGGGGGGGIVVHGVKAQISHATIAYNRIAFPLVLGQGLLIQPWPSPENVQQRAIVDLNHSIIANHAGGGAGAAAVVVQQNSTLNFNQGLFAGNTKDTNVDKSPVPVGTINGLQTVQNASSAGFIAPSPPYHNYHLRIDSPAKDQVTVISLTDDIDRQARPYGNRSDFGADEYHPLVLAVIPGDGRLHLDWTAGARMLAGGVGHYEVAVTCEARASPPNEVNCGESLNVGTSTVLSLTGLTNFKWYTIEVKSFDVNSVLFASSGQIRASPTNLFVFLPLVLR